MTPQDRQDYRRRFVSAAALLDKFAHIPDRRSRITHHEEPLAEIVESEMSLHARAKLTDCG